RRTRPSAQNTRPVPQTLRRLCARAGKCPTRPTYEAVVEVANPECAEDVSCLPREEGVTGGCIDVDEGTGVDQPQRTQPARGPPFARHRAVVHPARLQPGSVQFGGEG